MGVTSQAPLNSYLPVLVTSQALNSSSLRALVTSQAPLSSLLPALVTSQAPLNSLVVQSTLVDSLLRSPQQASKEETSVSRMSAVASATDSEELSKVTSVSLADVVSMINSELSVVSPAALSNPSSPATKLVSNKVVSRAALIQASRVFKDTLAASSPAMAVAVAMVAKASASALAPAPATEEAEEDIEDTARATRRRVPTSSSLNSRRTTRDSSTT